MKPFEGYIGNPFMRAGFVLVCVSLLVPLAAAQRPGREQLKNQAMEGVEARRKLVQEITDSLFSFSELGYHEVESAKYLTDLLEKDGFRINLGVSGMPTAFVAEWGSGKPVIGFMADIDGLPETSQTPGVAYHRPLIEGGPGHGEGHNAGQAVNVTAALVVKDSSKNTTCRERSASIPVLPKSCSGAALTWRARGCSTISM